MAGAVGAQRSPALAAHGPGPFDVAIVGAGPAGIAAGRALASAHKKFVILEGRNRLGGRTFTDTTSFPGGIRWDVGAQWLHESTPSTTKGIGPTNNPLTNIALSRGIDVFPDLNPRFLLSSPGVPVDMLDSPAIKTFAEVGLAIAAAGLIALKRPGLDIPWSRAVADLKHLPYFNLIVGMFEVALGGEATDLSSADLAVAMKTALLPPCIPSPDNWLIPSGYGSLVASLAVGLPIALETTVDTITWGTKHGVALETNRGTVVAKKVIVTTPIGPLAAGRPEFVPELPARFGDALDGLAMGSDEKIGLLFKPSFQFDVPSDHSYVPQDNAFIYPNANTRKVPYIQTRAFGHPHFAIVIGAGDDVTTAAAQHKLIPYALEQVVNAYGSSAAKAFAHGAASDWNNSAFSMGSYSFAKPHGLPARTALQAPFGNQIYFAGEAVVTGAHSAAHGAFIAGHYQALKVIKALKA